MVLILVDLQFLFIIFFKKNQKINLKLSFLYKKTEFLISVCFIGGYIKIATAKLNGQVELPIKNLNLMALRQSFGMTYTMTVKDIAKKGNDINT